MVTLKIEDNEKKYIYKIPEFFLSPGRKLILFSGRNPILFRTIEGVWYYRARGCNLCGACCILGETKEDVSKNEKLPQKEMEGKIVCAFLEKERYANLIDMDAPVNPKSPKKRTIGSPLKEKTNAEVYVCTNPAAPFNCSAGPFRRPDCKKQKPIKGCTIIYKKVGK